jgi:hypothetical protein
MGKPFAYLAVCILVIVGLVEFALRLVFALICLVTIIGIIVLLEMGDDFFQPICWKMALRIALFNTPEHLSYEKIKQLERDVWS